MRGMPHGVSKLSVTACSPPPEAAGPRADLASLGGGEAAVDDGDAVGPPRRDGVEGVEQVEHEARPAHRRRVHERGAQAQVLGEGDGLHPRNPRRAEAVHVGDTEAGIFQRGEEALRLHLVRRLAGSAPQGVLVGPDDGALLVARVRAHARLLLGVAIREASSRKQRAEDAEVALSKDSACWYQPGVFPGPALLARGSTSETMRSTSVS